MKGSLSAVLIVGNEEKNLPRAVESVRFADEILVVDGGSTDGTVRVARELGARVVENPWPGFAAQRNFAIAEAEGEWILFIDADEEVTPELAREVKETISSEPIENGFLIPRRGLFLGRWIRHGSWGRDRILRLFRRERGHVPERRIHESVVVDGKVGRCSGILLHYAQPGFSEIGGKFAKYIPLSAEEIAGKRTGIPSIEIPPRILAAFIRDYILRLGFLDGFEGFVLAVWGAISVMAKYSEAKLIIEGRGDAAGN